MASFLGMLPGDIAQGLIWGIMALGVFMTFKLLNFPDMTVDGTFATGGAVTVMLILAGVPVPVALLIAFAAGIGAGLISGPSAPLVVCHDSTLACHPESRAPRDPYPLGGECGTT